MKTGQFLTPLHAEKLTGKFWKIDQTYWFERPNGQMVPTPAGLVTDWASTDIKIPLIGRVSVPGFPNDDSYDQGAGLHDGLYQAELLPRPLMDLIFREALVALRDPVTGARLVSDLKAQEMYIMVRMFGGWTYKEHDQESIRSARALYGVPDTEKRPLWPDGVLRFV